MASTSGATGPILRLIDALKARGVTATPRQIEDARPMWDFPQLPRQGPVPDEVVAAYEDLLPLLGTGRSRDQAALVCFARGHPVRESIVREALTWKPPGGPDPLALLPVPSEPPDPAEALGDLASRLASAGMLQLQHSRNPLLAYITESLQDATDLEALPVSLEDLGEQRSQPVERWVEAAARRIVRVPPDADLDDPHVTDPLAPPELAEAFPALTAIPAILEACRLPSMADLNHEARVVSMGRLRTFTQVLRRLAIPFLAQVIGESRLSRVSDPAAWLDRLAVDGALNALALFRHNSRLLATLPLLLAEAEGMEPLTSAEALHYAQLWDGDPAAIAEARVAALAERLPLTERELARLAELTNHTRRGDRQAAKELASIIYQDAPRLEAQPRMIASTSTESPPT